MPVDTEDLSPVTVRVAPSAAIEIDFLLCGCTTKRTDRIEQLGLDRHARRVQAFWDGEVHQSELLVVAERVGALSGWEIASILAVTPAQLAPAAAMDLSSEPDDVRATIVRRITRLARERKLRTAYLHLIADLWELASEHVDRDAVERTVVTWNARVQDGENPAALFGERHLIHRKSVFGEAFRRELPGGRVLLTPSTICGVAGMAGHVFALPTAYSVAGPAFAADPLQANRAAAERTSSRLRVFADPTRVTILFQLARQPMTVSEIARATYLSQPTASVHVQKLRAAGLLDHRRDGARVVYSTSRERLDGVLRAAEADLTQIIS